MKILVIPDVHLKPQMFKQATALMHQGIADRAVCLMDIPDDWDTQYNVGLYEETYDEAVRFAKAFPETAWCYGNHDLSYLWHCLESGYSSMASMTVQRKLLDLREAVPEDNPIKYVQRIDNVLFSHGGVLNFFVEVLLGIIQLQGVVFTLQAGCTYPVACSQSVKDGNTQIKTDVFVEIITHLLAESAVDCRIIIRTETSAESQLRIVTALGDSDTVFTSFQTILCSLY